MLEFRKQLQLHFMYFANQSSTYQPYDSVGSLSMVSVPQIREEQNLDYLQNLCGFIDQMNLNPLWYQSESTDNKLKLLQIYQMAINYSKNLSQNYSKEIQGLQSKKSQLKQEAIQKQRKIRAHKAKVQRMKENFRRRKHKYYKDVYKNLKCKLRDEEEREYDRRYRKGSFQHSQPPEVVYYPVQAPSVPNYFPRPEIYPPGEVKGNIFPSPQIPFPQPQPEHQYPPQVPPFNLNNASPQRGQNPLFNEDQIRNGLKNMFPGAQTNNQHQIPQDKDKGNVNSKQKSIVKKRTNKSILIQQKQDMVVQEEQTSEIIGKHSRQSNKFQKLKPETKKTSKVKPKTSLQRSEYDDFDYIPDLMQKSRKNQNLESKMLVKHESKQICNTEEQMELDSMAKISLGKGSSTNLIGGNNLLSKISKDPSHKKANNEQLIKLSAVREEQLGLSLPGKGNVSKKNQNRRSKISIKVEEKAKDQREQSPRQSILEPIIDDIMHGMLEGSKFTKKNDSKPNQVLMNTTRPKRASQIPNLQGDKNQDEKQLIQSKDNDIFDMDLKGQSRVHQKKNVHFSQQKKDETHNNNKLNEENFNFGDIVQSTIKKKKNNQEKGNTGGTLKVQMHDDRPVRKSQDKGEKGMKGSGLRSSSAQSDRNNEVENNLHLSVGKKQEFGDIMMSNVGSKSGQSHNEEKMFDDKPQRSSVQNKDKDNINNLRQSKMSSASKVAINQQAIEEKNEDQDYGDDFQIEEVDLMKTNIKQKKKEDKDDFDFDPVSLEESYKPKSKKQEPKDKSELKKPQISSKKPQKSAVDIAIPSTESLNELSKYHKLKNQEFKVKLNIAATVRTQTFMSSSEDPFQFIPCIPANSIIAKRPFLHSQVIKKQQSKIAKSVSVGQAASNQSISSSGNISINVIHPDNVKEKIQSKNDYKASEDVVKEPNLKIESNDQTDALKNLELPIVFGPLESVITQKVGEGEKNNKAPVRKQSQQEIQLKLQDDSNIGSRQDIRKQILTMIKRFEVSKKFEENYGKFDDRMMDETLKKVCKVNKINSIRSIDEIEKYSNLLDKEIQKLKFDGQKTKKTVDEVLKAENITLETPPKLNQNSPLQDSLFYSNSSFKDRSNMKFGSKVESKEPADSNLTLDMAESIQFNTSNASPPPPLYSALPFEQNNQIKEEKAIDFQQKKEQKTANKYIIQNVKSDGLRQKQKLLKNAGEGIDKFDKDDELNREVMNLKNKKQAQEDYDDDSEWD